MIRAPFVPQLLHVAVVLVIGGIDGGSTSFLFRPGKYLSSAWANFL